jgi:hypothetical protein
MSGRCLTPTLAPMCLLFTQHHLKSQSPFSNPICHFEEQKTKKGKTTRNTSQQPEIGGNQDDLLVTEERIRGKTATRPRIRCIVDGPLAPAMEIPSLDQVSRIPAKRRVCVASEPSRCNSGAISLPNTPVPITPPQQPSQWRILLCAPLYAIIRLSHGSQYPDSPATYEGRTPLRKVLAFRVSSNMAANYPVNATSSQSGIIFFGFSSCDGVTHTRE